MEKEKIRSCFNFTNFTKQSIDNWSVRGANQCHCTLCHKVYGVIKEQKLIMISMTVLGIMLVTLSLEYSSQSTRPFGFLLLKFCPEFTPERKR